MHARLIAVLGALALALAGGLAAAEGYGQQKAVYHVNGDGESGTSYRAAMNNVQNHINAVGAENLEVKVILHGDGLGLLMAARTDVGLQTVVGGLKAQGVTFQVCNNTLRGREISYENDLYDVWEEDIVDSGVAELAHLQAQGYTYIKP
jgi:hypothetical protein